MSEQQIKDYLEKYNITSKELLAKHIEELKRNTKPNTKLISELVWVLEDEESVFNSFLAENFKRQAFKQIGINTDGCKMQASQSYYTSPEKENNIVFPKDSEIYKEEEPYIAPPNNYTHKDVVEVREKLKERGIKESNGKTDYSEIDWDFIEAQALRMNKNKGKYEAGNYKKPMNINLLKQSLLRHVLEVLKDNYQDDGDELGHLSAIALNAQFLHYQLKNNVK